MSKRNPVRSGVKRKDVPLASLSAVFASSSFTAASDFLISSGSANGSALPVRASTFQSLPSFAWRKCSPSIHAPVTAGVPCRPNVSAAAG